MSEDEIRWIAAAVILYDCLLFIQKGRHGAQPVLFPRRLYAAATLHKE